jgi:hypothetical protein
MAYKIDISALHRQSFSFKVESKDIKINLYFSLNLNCFIMDLVYGDFILNGTRLVNNLNLLNKYKNILPFGVQIIGDHDPLFIDDFERGNNVFMILDREEIKEIE